MIKASALCNPESASVQEDFLNLEGCVIGKHQLGKLAFVETKTIAGGRGHYALCTYEVKLPDGTPAWMTVYDLDAFGVNQHPQYPLHEGRSVAERMEDKILHYKFTHRADLASFADNPLIVKVFEVGEDSLDKSVVETDISSLLEGHPETEFKVKKQNLAYLVTEQWNDAIIAPMTSNEAVDLYTRLADGFADLHKKGIFHRGICAEVIRGTSTHPKVIDFYNGENFAEQGFTLMTMDWGGRDGDLGEIRCMAPEQLRKSSANPAREVYSLGHTLFYALTGAYLNREHSITAVLAENLRSSHSIVLPSSLQKFAPLIGDSVRLDPNARPTMTEFAQRLRELKRD